MSKNQVQNTTLYKTPFSIGYWKSAAADCKSLRMILIASLMIAMCVALRMFTVPVPGTQSLRIMFTFIPSALCCAITGPFIGIVYGFAGDIIGYFVNPMGAFFPGYTAQAMLTALIYALFLYRSKVSVLRIVLSRAIINVLCNAIIGSYFTSVLYSNTFVHYFSISIVKNLLLLPIECIILVAVFQAVFPAITRSDLIHGQPGKIIPII